MREKIKCPECGLVQWREDACKRCNFSFTTPPSSPPQAASPPPSDAPAPAAPEASAVAGPSNPYAPPAASAPSQVPANSPAYGVITEALVQELEKGSPWMRFLAILAFLGAALQIIAASLAFSATETLGGPYLPLIYLLSAVINIAIATRLSGSATAIKKIRRGGGAEALTQSARHQNALWQMIGIFSLLAILLIVVIVLIGANMSFR